MACYESHIPADSNKSFSPPPNPPSPHKRGEEEEEEEEEEKKERKKEKSWLNELQVINTVI